MGRSKKNWDHLVDFFGNYGIDIANGIYPGSPNTPGIKGNKGEMGLEGLQGDKGLQGSKGDQGYGKKGDKGATGPDGLKGEVGEAAGLFNFLGTKPDQGYLPPDPEPGDVWWITDENLLVVWDGTFWVEMQVTAVKGEKGEYGDTGDKGEPGLDGLPGAGGSQGIKGEPGEDYDPLVLDDYYKDDQIDAMIEFFHEPEKAFNVNYYKDTTSIVSNELVNFFSNDQQDELYNPGIVLLEPSCTIQDSPVASASQVVVNYVIDDSGRARGLGYQMIQHVYAVSETSITDDAYWRLVRPGQSQFGDWHLTQFNADRYYTKTELDARIGDQGLVLIDGLLENTETLALVDSNGVINPSAVRIHAQGGLTLTRNNDTLTIDGSPLAGQLSFLGLVSITEDVSVSVPAPVPGNYFIFKDSGVDINTGETVAVGDWLIYGEDPAEWRWLDMSQSYGVAEVRLKAVDSYLSKSGTVQFPELSFDTDSYAVDYAALQGASDLVSPNIFSCRNVDKSWEGTVNSRKYNTKARWGETLQPGEYSVNVKEKKIKLALVDQDGKGVTGFQSDLSSAVFLGVKSTLKSPASSDSEVLSSSLEVDGLVITVKDRSPVIYAAGVSSIDSVSFYPTKSRTIEDKDSLVWNLAENRFIPARAGEGYFVEVGGDTLEGDIDMDSNDLHGLSNPPAQDSSAVSKKWVEEQLAKIAVIPAGSVLFWPTQKSTPSGWKKMDGGSYNVSQNPQMDSVLRNMAGYLSGKMPNWGGRFLVQSGGDNAATAGSKLSRSTARPSNQFVTNEDEGHTHFMGSAAKVDGKASEGRFYPNVNGPLKTSKAGAHDHRIISGGDTTTRPDCVTGYWIMKLD